MAQAMSTADRPQGDLQRVIGVGGLGFSVANYIVGAGIFGLPGLAAAIMGPAAVLGYLICAFLIGLVGLCYAETGSRVVSNGGSYAYARAAFGPTAGGVAAIMIIVSYCAATAAVANLMIDTLATLLPALGAMPWRPALLIVVFALLALANIRGASSGSRLSVLLAVLKLTPLVLLVVCGLFVVRGTNLQWHGLPSSTSIGQGSVLLFYAFMGGEGALSVSGEVVNPTRTIPRAILLAIALVAALFIGLQVVAQGVLGAALPNSTSPLVAAAGQVFGQWGGRALVVTTLLSVGGYLSADMLCTPRILHAVAERGQLPRAMMAVHPRLGTPAVAIVVYAVLCALLASSGSFQPLVVLASATTLVLYLIIACGLLRLRAHGVRSSDAPFVAPGGKYLPLAVIVIVGWLLTTLARDELIASFGLAIAAAVCYALHTARAARRATTEPSNSG